MKKIIILSVAIVLLAGCGKPASFSPSAPEMPADCLTDPWTAVDVSGYLLQAGPGAAAVRASSGATRSHLESDGDSKVAVLWTPADSFKMLTRNEEDGKNWIATFTTSGSGPTAEFLTGNDIFGHGSSFHCVYPEMTKFGHSDGLTLLGINVPVEQTAIPGGIAEGLNYSYAYTEQKGAELHFSNVLSLLRFRLSGEKASTLESIEFKAEDRIAGDLMFIPEDGVPFMTQR